MIEPASGTSVRARDDAFARWKEEWVQDRRVQSRITRHLHAGGIVVHAQHDAVGRGQRRGAQERHTVRLSTMHDQGAMMKTKP